MKNKIRIFLLITAMILVGGFFVFLQAFASSENITQINFTSSPQTIDPDTISAVLSTQTQNINGTLEQITETNHLTLSSSSATGEFSSSSTNWVSVSTLTMSKNSANKNFYYRDSTPGTYTLTISVEGKSWTSATQEIVINSPAPVKPTPEPAKHTDIDSDITVDTTWMIDDSPYLISTPISVAVGATLTIDPGVVVKFDSGAILVVDGVLNTNGTADNEIYFTSAKDDSVGGDTNGDGEDSYPDLGDWDCILIENPDTKSTLNNIIQRYSQNGLILYNGGSVTSEDFNSDKEIMFMGSHSSFNNLNVPNIEIYEKSEISINTATLSNLRGSAIEINNSSLDIKNSTIDSGWYEAVDIFNNSSAIFDNVKITGERDGIDIFNNSSLDFANGSISCGNDGFVIFNKSNVNISKTKITDAGDAGIITFTNTEPNIITITESEITGNEYGLLLFNDFSLSANRNSIHDNSSGGAFYYGSIPPSNFDFTNNWWGDESGPYNLTTNPDGFGDAISDNFLFTPWLKSDPLKGKTPVIIIPGIMGTQLIKDYGDKEEIWPAITKVVTSITDNFLRDLELLPSGEKNLDFPINVGNIIRNAPSTDVFDGLISELTTNGGYTKGEDLFFFPYDWRLSNSTNAILLKEKIEQILSSTGEEKVDIVAHSMGGLLAKEYIADNGKDKVDNLIFLGTPHLGAPKAFKALVYGDSMGFNIGPLNLLRSKIVKAISQNMPSIYELLPSSKYVSNLRYISEKTSGADSIYFDYEATKNLLIEKGTNQNLVQSADTFHQNIDDLDLSGIKVSNISACGEKTISSIEIKKTIFGEDYSLHYANGDETVPLDSSTGISNVGKYFIDKVAHSSLPSVEDVPSVVLDILEDKTIPIESKIFVDINKCSPINGMILSVHSPISLDIYDPDGNHSGFDENGDIENNIPGASYDTIGEAKFAFIPDGVNVNVKGVATDSGTFDLAIEKVVDSKTIETKFWNDIPIILTSQMNFDLNTYSDIDSIKVDNKNLLTSNTLSQNEDYLDVPAKAKETSNYSRGGSYVVYEPIQNKIIKEETLPEVKKQKLAKKSPVLVNKKPARSSGAGGENIQKKETVPASNLSASAVNTGQGTGLWSTIKLFFNWLFHIRK